MRRLGSAESLLDDYFGPELGGFPLKELDSIDFISPNRGGGRAGGQAGGE